METLDLLLDDLIERLTNPKTFRTELESLKSVYPFSKYEYIISHLLSSKKLSIDGYYKLRNDYLNRNLYLFLFEISAPRGFGEVWAHGWLKGISPSLLHPSKKLDKKYSGEYDFLLDPKIRIEVKASRAVDFDSSEPLFIKALSSSSKKRFDMNFQQIKPRCCDVFVWMAAWRDTIKYWVVPSYNVENNKYYSKGQHRGNTGEGQLHLNQENIHEFDKYLCSPTAIESAIRKAYKAERRLRSKNKQL